MSWLRLKWLGLCDGLGLGLSRVMVKYGGQMSAMVVFVRGGGQMSVGANVLDSIKRRMDRITDVAGSWCPRFGSRRHIGSARFSNSVASVKHREGDELTYNGPRCPYLFFFFFFCSPVLKCFWLTPSATSDAVGPAHWQRLVLGEHVTSLLVKPYATAPGAAAAAAAAAVAIGTQCAIIQLHWQCRSNNQRLVHSTQSELNCIPPTDALEYMLSEAIEH